MMNAHRYPPDRRLLRIVFVGGYDSTNHVYVELFHELTSRGHSCTVVVDNPRDLINNGMLVHAGIPLVALSDYPLSELAHVDLVVAGPFLRRHHGKLFDAIDEHGVFLVSFANLFTAVTMRITPDLVITPSAAKFAEFAAAGVAYATVALGNPQYDPLIRARDQRGARSIEGIRRVLVVEQGAYPFGTIGKEQLAATLTAMARNNPEMTFVVKPRYMPGEDGEYLHGPTEHLYHFLTDTPENLALSREPSVLEEILPGFDAMVTTWSTAHLDAAALGMPLLLIDGLDSIDVYDVRSQRVEEAYRHLAATGCVVDWRDLLEKPCEFKLVADEYVRREFHDPASPCAPVAAELFEAIAQHLLRPGLMLAEKPELPVAEFVRRLECGEMATRPSHSREALLDRRLRRQVNELLQALVFDNRVLGFALDTSSMRTFALAKLDPAAGESGVDDTITQTRAAIHRLKSEFFLSHTDELADDPFVQDAYFDWLAATGRSAELLEYQGPVAAPESLAYCQGVALLKRGRLLTAARRLADSFGCSLSKPVRQLRKDRNVSLVVSQSDRNLLGQAILIFLSLMGRSADLATVDVPERSGMETLVHHKVQALMALRRRDEALAVYEQYVSAITGAQSPPSRGGIQGLLLRASTAAHRTLLAATVNRLTRR